VAAGPLFHLKAPLNLLRLFLVNLGKEFPYIVKQEIGLL
jgi:hypothetical protein